MVARQLGAATPFPGKFFPRQTGKGEQCSPLQKFLGSRRPGRDKSLPCKFSRQRLPAARLRAGHARPLQCIFVFALRAKTPPYKKGMAHFHRSCLLLCGFAVYVGITPQHNRTAGTSSRRGCARCPSERGSAARSRCSKQRGCRRRRPSACPRPRAASQSG